MGAGLAPGLFCFLLHACSAIGDKMKYKVKDTTISQDITIKLKFEGDSWATMTFQENYPDDPKRRWWNVIIAGDWGQWSYGWSYSGMSKRTIFEFMSSMAKDSYYLPTKFIGAEPKVFDAEASKTAMRKVIKEEVPWVAYKKRNEHLMYLINEINVDDTDRDFMDSIDKELDEVLGGELWQFLVYKTNARTANFFKNIFPKFFPAIKKLAKQYKE